MIFWEEKVWKLNAFHQNANRVSIPWVYYSSGTFFYSLSVCVSFDTHLFIALCSDVWSNGIRAFKCIKNEVFDGWQQQIYIYIYMYIHQITVKRTHALVIGICFRIVTSAQLLFHFICTLAGFVYPTHSLFPSFSLSVCEYRLFGISFHSLWKAETGNELLEMFGIIRMNI